MDIKLKNNSSEILRVKGGPIKIEDNSTTDGCTMQYDSTEECMKFVFN